MNGDLLETLLETSNEFNCIWKKIEEINSLVFTEHQEILAMLSEEGEKIYFKFNMNDKDATDSVEDCQYKWNIRWLFP